MSEEPKIDPDRLEMELQAEALIQSIIKITKRSLPDWELSAFDDFNIRKAFHAGWIAGRESTKPKEREK